MSMSRSKWSRSGAAALVAGAVSFAWLPSAGAASTVTIPLDPSSVMIYPAAVESEGRVDPADPEQLPAYTAVPVEWTGSAVLQLPPELDGSTMDVDLDLAPTDEADPTRTYSTTTPGGPDELLVTDTATAGEYVVSLPADDLANGPVGWLTFYGITSTVPGDVEVLPLSYQLEFTGTGALAQPLTTQLAVMSMSACGGMFGEPCTAHVVEPGGTLAFTVPPTSLLRAFGVGTLSTVSAHLLPTDEDGYPTEEAPILLGSHVAVASASTSETVPPAVVEGLAGAMAPPAGAIPLTEPPAATTGPYSASLTLPADLAPGRYGVSLFEGATAADNFSVSYFELEVPAPAPAPRAVNTGLLSDTGWEDAPATPAGETSPLVSLGIGMVLAAGLTGAAVLRSGRRPAESE